MNIYEDYSKYFLENMDLIATLKEHNSQIMLMIEDVIKVLDYLYNKVKKGYNLEKEEDEIFDIGYGYFSNVMHDIKTYYNDYFNKDYLTFDHFTQIMIYYIYTDDVLGYLDSMETDDTDSVLRLNKLSKTLDDILINKKKFNNDDLTRFDAEIESCLPNNHSYRPTHIVFGLIAEQLDLNPLPQD